MAPNEKCVAREPRRDAKGQAGALCSEHKRALVAAGDRWWRDDRTREELDAELDAIAAACRADPACRRLAAGEPQAPPHPAYLEGQRAAMDPTHWLHAVFGRRERGAGR